MDELKLQYLLAKKEISRASLAESMGWSPGTCWTRVSVGDNWKVDEVNKLIRLLGFTEEEIKSVFAEEGRQ